MSRDPVHYSFTTLRIYVLHGHLPGEGGASRAKTDGVGGST